MMIEVKCPQGGRGRRGSNRRTVPVSNRENTAKSGEGSTRIAALHTPCGDSDMSGMPSNSILMNSAGNRSNAAPALKMRGRMRLEFDEFATFLMAWTASPVAFGQVVWIYPRIIRFCENGSQPLNEIDGMVQLVCHIMTQRPQPLISVHGPLASEPLRAVSAAARSVRMPDAARSETFGRRYATHTIIVGTSAVD